MRLAIEKAEDFSILAVHWAATFYSHLFENEHPPSQPFQNPLEVNFAPLRLADSNKGDRVGCNPLKSDVSVELDSRKTLL